MGWTYLPVSVIEKTLIKKGVFQDLYDTIIMLWNICPPFNSSEPREPQSYMHLMDASDEEGRVGIMGGLYPPITDYYPLLLHYLVALWWMNADGVGAARVVRADAEFDDRVKLYCERTRFYYDSGDGIVNVRSWDWLMTEAGIPADSWLRTEPYAGTGYTEGAYVIDSINFAHPTLLVTFKWWRVYKCVQTHGTAKDPITEKDYWECTNLMEPANVNDLYLLIAYMITYAWGVHKPVRQGRGVLDGQFKYVYSDYTEGSFNSLKSTMTGLVNTAFSSPDDWIDSFGGSAVTGNIAAGDDYYFISDAGAIGTVSKGGSVRLLDTNFHADSKDSDSEYILHFTKQYNATGGQGGMVTSITAGGRGLGSVGTREQVIEQLDILYSDWDWGNNWVEVTYNNSGWSMFVPPEPYDSPPAWSDGSVAYGLGDIVSYTSEEWQCILAHTSDSGKAPGDPSIYWDSVSNDYSWPIPDWNSFTSYLWTVPALLHILVLPVYAGW